MISESMILINQNVKPKTNFYLQNSIWPTIFMEILQNTLTKNNEYTIDPRKFIIVFTLFYIVRVPYASKSVY